jgi:hypothetical protein
MIQETKPKVVNMFWYDLKLHDKFSKWNTKFGKIYTLKNSYLFYNDSHKTCDLLGQLYVFLITSYKIFHSKILFYEKVKKS